MAYLRSEVVGRKLVEQRLKAIRARAVDLRTFWQDVFAPRYFAAIQDIFALEGQRRNIATGRFSQGTWRPLSDRYAAWKARHFPGARILEREGTLRESLRWTGSGLGPGGIWEVTAQHVRFGTSVPYATHHMKGTPTMPARPFLDKPDKSVFAPQLKKYLLDQA
jgi:hypothetical protein